MFRLTPIVKYLLIINVVIFLLGMLLYSQTGLHINQFLALYYIGSDNFAAWQFVTYMFLHADFGHLFSNMLGLIIFGAWLEEVWDPKRFLLYYMITGIGAGVLFMGVQYFEKSAMEEDVQTWLSDPGPYDFEVLVKEHFQMFRPPGGGNFFEQYRENPDSPRLEQEAISWVMQATNQVLNIPMVGASGAIFGILLAAGLLFPQRRIMLLIPPIPMKARILVILYGAYTVYSAFQRAPTDNVAHFAHLGGMVVGYILLKIWDEDRKRYY